MFPVGECGSQLQSYPQPPQSADAPVSVTCISGGRPTAENRTGILHYGRGQSVNTAETIVRPFRFLLWGQPSAPDPILAYLVYIIMCL